MFLRSQDYGVCLHRSMSSVLAAFAFLAAACAAVVPSHAQQYPNKPIRLIVPYPPGGVSDAVGRLVAQGLSERLGQTVVVDNRPGAGSQIGHEAQAKAAPDGYTLILGTADGLAILPVLRKRLPYDPIKDFTPIGLVARNPLIFAVSAKFPAHTLQEFVAYANAHPGAVRYGSAGIGSMPHFAVELLRTSAGIHLVHVPYKGGAPVMTDLIAGQIDMAATNADLAKRFHESAQIKVLAQASNTRHPLLPNIPTTAEAGMPDVVVSSYFGVLGPANLPQSIVARVSKDLATVVEQPAMRKRFIDIGAESTPTSPERFSQFIIEEIQKWRKVVATAGIPLQDY